MNRRDSEELTDIPAMVPAIDEVADRRAPAGRSAKHRTAGSSQRPRGSGSGRQSGGVFGLVSIIFAVAALGACYFLWEQSRDAQLSADQAEARIAGLEAQLASTGDELSQSDAAVRVKLKELDSEVRKLWDSRKKSNSLAGEQSTTLKNLTTRTGSTRKQVEALDAKLTGWSAELDEVVEMLNGADFENHSALLSEARKKIQQMQSELLALEGRVAANEEWVESINAFRRQVNQRLNTSAIPESSRPVLQ